MKIKNGHLIDNEGRFLQLRGVNLGGSSKVPYSPDGATWKPDSLKEPEKVSFIGRPFPLEEADEHFSRLKSWGFTFLRFLITWEAIEHAGPGIYDEAYLDYLYAVVKKAGDYGINLFIDPHEDVWSRFSGGDGAPAWTFDAIGLDITRLHATGAAFLHQQCLEAYPTMIWPTNNERLAAATLFTLFFAGSDFAPQTRVDGIPIQEYLQGHYIRAIRQVALRLKDLPNMVGYDTLNEPSAGFIGVKDFLGKGDFELLKGPMPGIYQSMLLSSGYPQEVEVYDLGLTDFVKKGTQVLNPDGLSAWKEGYADIWRQHGVWGVDAQGKPRLLKPDYFTHVGDHPVDFNRDYFKPFANRFAREIRSICPQALIFVESVPNQTELSWGTQDAPDVVHAAHWYDDITLITKNFRAWFTIDTQSRKIVLGNRAVRRYFARRIGDIIRQSKEKMNGTPTLIGEIGIPFDMQHKKAYRSGDFSTLVRAMDTSLNALESNFVSFTLWDYTADNTNAHGDQWNEEDLSIFSRDQKKGTGDLNDGGRALQAVIRPYARCIPGEPIFQAFDIQERVFQLTFAPDPAIQAPLEIYVPAFHYPDGVEIESSGGRYSFDVKAQTLLYYPTGKETVEKLTLRPKRN